ncbi:unnamed protein product [Sphenostylis stenocarpa]|uniref:Uncharacterized protein n=1 Tax=Sphenostylis stenocarpa TaxID=92480 RepID=A0AA86SZQ7_9FABA|nr:unnamed protein product [Sphenostylis stenocarpa]
MENAVLSNSHYLNSFRALCSIITTANGSVITIDRFDFKSSVPLNASVLYLIQQSFSSCVKCICAFTVTFTSSIKLLTLTHKYSLLHHHPLLNLKICVRRAGIDM